MENIDIDSMIENKPSSSPVGNKFSIEYLKKNGFVIGLVVVVIIALVGFLKSRSRRNPEAVPIISIPATNGGTSYTDLSPFYKMLNGLTDSMNSKTADIYKAIDEMKAKEPTIESPEKKKERQKQESKVYNIQAEQMYREDSKHESDVINKIKSGMTFNDYYNQEIKYLKDQRIKFPEAFKNSDNNLDSSAFKEVLKKKYGSSPAMIKNQPIEKQKELAKVAEVDAEKRMKEDMKQEAKMSNLSKLGAGTSSLVGEEMNYMSKQGRETNTQIAKENVRGKVYESTLNKIIASEPKIKTENISVSLPLNNTPPPVKKVTPPPIKTVTPTPVKPVTPTPVKPVTAVKPYDPYDYNQYINYMKEQSKT